jgi:hypothetical protein
MAVDRQVCQEAAHLLGTHLKGMPNVMKKDEPPNSVHVRVFGAQRQVPHSATLSHLV